MSNNNNKFVG